VFMQRGGCSQEEMEKAGVPAAPPVPAGAIPPPPPVVDVRPCVRTSACNERGSHHDCMRCFAGYPESTLARGHGGCYVIGSEAGWHQPISIR